MTRAAIDGRDSSENQREASIEDQACKGERRALHPAVKALVTLLAEVAVDEYVHEVSSGQSGESTGKETVA